MTPYKKARPGQPLRISANEWNAVREMIPGLAPTIMDPGEIGSGWEGDTVLVVNATGSDRDQFEIMKINAPIITPTEGLAEFKRRVALSCVAVTDGSPFVVLAEPIKAGKIGRAIVSGCAPVRVTGTAASFVTASAGVYATLAMSSTGTNRVLWDEGGSGTRWAIIRIGDAGSGSSTGGIEFGYWSDTPGSFVVAGATENLSVANAGQSDSATFTTGSNYIRLTKNAAYRFDTQVRLTLSASNDTHTRWSITLQNQGGSELYYTYDTRFWKTYGGVTQLLYTFTGIITITGIISPVTYTDARFKLTNQSGAATYTVDAVYNQITKLKDL